MRVFLFCGDTHGDLDFLERALALAAEHDAEMVVLGDFGFIWPGSNQQEHVSRLCARYDVKMRFIDGNHEDHVTLRALQRTTSSLEGGGVEIAPGVIYQPRGSTYEDSDGTRFLFCGGAPSIDYQFRKEGRSWWEKEEVISEEEYQTAMNAVGPFHVLVTHDTHSYPPGYGPKGTPEFQERSTRSMGMIAGLVAKHRPPVHLHGHWHARHDDYRMPGTVTHGLAANVNRFQDAVMLWSRS